MVRTWASHLYGSWLCRIEAQFSACRNLEPDGTDHNSHTGHARMIRRYR